jgi:purine nucleosidase
MPTRIILDCDPGHDDAIAILLAHGSPEIELLAITTVVGNQTLAKVTRNALAVAAVAGIAGVPIAAGASSPLVEPLEHASSIHGESGMDGPELPDSPAVADPRHAVDLIVETIMTEPAGSVTLVPTGGLTNIALAVRREPRIVDRVKEVVLMGGAYGPGNWSAVAEFNIVIDPEAAAIVFDAGWTVTMVGLDVTHRALATPEVRRAVRAVGTRAAGFVDELLEFFTSTYELEQGFAHPPVHDPCAVALVIDPSIFTIERRPIDIELRGVLTRGMTVVDRRGPQTPESATRVATGIDVARFWSLVVDALERIG